MEVMTDNRYDQYFNQKEKELRDRLSNWDISLKKEFLRKEFPDGFLEKMERDREHNGTPEDQYYTNVVVKWVKHKLQMKFLEDVSEGPENIKAKMDDRKLFEDPDKYFEEIEELKQK